MGEEPPPGFGEEDFEAFHPSKWRGSEFNAERLAVRRKISAGIPILQGRLAGLGLSLASQVSIHNPYIFNRFSVDSLSGYFSRPDPERKNLRDILGVEFGKELDAGYTHAILVFGLRLEGMETAFKIHAQAWWDGQNLKNRSARAEEREALRKILNGLPDFFLTIHDWKKEYPCGDLGPRELEHFLGLYTPGNHWLHLRRRRAKASAIEAAAGIWPLLAEELAALIPVYRFAAWSPANNHVFKGPGEPAP